MLVLCWSRYLALFSTKLGDFWCSFCAGLLCFFERWTTNHVISSDLIEKYFQKNLYKNTWVLVLILRWSIVLFLALVGGLALPYNILPLMCTESLAGPRDPLVCLQFFELLVIFELVSCPFLNRNLAISGARFALVSCAFLQEPWRFLVLVLCWSPVLF